MRPVRHSPGGVAVVAARPSAPIVAATLRRNGIRDLTVLGSTSRTADRPPPAVHTMEFDGAHDLWRLRSDDGTTTAAVVILADADLDPRRIAGVGADLHTLLADSRVAHLGTTMHEMPNLFWTHSPAGANWPHYPVRARAEYAARCIVATRRAGCSRIQLRRAVQHESARRWAADPRPGRRLPRPYSDHFDTTVAAERAPAYEYAGPAVLDAPGAELAVTVALNGHPDPIDGHYHWYGRLSAAEADRLPDPGRGAVSLRIAGGEPAPGRLQERDPWGNLRIAGIGRPPFPLADNGIH
jgi:hypothetical protein